MAHKWLIIGQGLAGSCLALRCMQNNIPFKLVDGGHKLSSSMVAAGMWNPLVFKRLTKSWQADVFTPEIFSFFRWAESFLDASFLKAEPVIRVLANAETIEQWQKRSAQPDFQQYFQEPNTDSTDIIIPEDGALGAVNQSGYINLPVFLEKVKTKLLQEQKLISTSLDYTQIIRTASGFTYQEEAYTHIIFAEGFQMKLHNSYFQYLPMNFTKGQVLDVEFEQEPSYSGILNKGVFCVHQGKKARIGATYEWNQPNTDITEEAKDYLVENFNKLSTLSFTIKDQKAGVRPTVIDRRPLLGEHPEEKGLYVFNGLGTKGVMLAPFLSAHFVEHLQQKTALWPDVDIKRFEAKHYKKS